jgi:hypothetical protein
LSQRGWNLAASFLISVMIATYLSIATDSVVSRDLFNSVLSLGSEAHREPNHVPQAVGGPKGGAGMLSMDEKLKKAGSIIRREMKHIAGDHEVENWDLLYQSVHGITKQRLIDKLKVAVLTG